MNVGIIFYRILIVVMIMFFGNAKADNIARLRQNADKIVVSLGSLLIDEKRTKVLLGDRLSPRTRIIVGKAVIGGIGHFMKHENAENFVLKYVDIDGRIDPYFIDGFDVVTGGKMPYCATAFVHATGYVVVNGALRLVGNRSYLNEEYIDKKCDEYLPENVAWIVKPVANAAVDVAYDYFTVRLVKAIDHGINKSR
jgi:hypothetical protein